MQNMTVPLRMKSLADELHVTGRTLLNDIDEINTLLQQLKQPPVILGKDGTIQLSPQTNATMVSSFLSNLSPYLYHQSPEERRLIIQVLLLTADHPIPLRELYESLFVARMTIYSDLSEIRKTMGEHFQIDSIPRVGVTLDCSATDARNQILAILLQQFSDIEAQTPIGHALLSIVGKHVPFETAATALTSVEKKSSVTLSERDFRQVVLRLFIAANDILSGRKLDKSSEESSEYFAAEYKFAELLFGEFEICDQSEIKSLAFALRQISSFSQNEDRQGFDVFSLAADLLNMLSKNLRTNLLNDNIVFDDLVACFNRGLPSFEAGDSISRNEISAMLESRYPNVQSILRHYFRYSELFSHQDISEEEIIQISFLICAALERRVIQAHKHTAVVVTPGNQALGSLIAEQLRTYFNLNVHAVIDRSFVSSTALLNVDLIVATCGMPDRGLPCVRVSPILDYQDYCSILHTITSARPLSKSYDSAANTNYFLSVIRPDMIHIEEDSPEWHQAIRLGGNLLVENADVPSAYIEAIIDTIEKYGPYFAFAPGLALAHARAQDKSISPAVSLVIFRQGFALGENNNNPIRMLFSAYEMESKRYLEICSAVMDIYNDHALFQRLIHAQDSREAYRLIQVKFSS